MGNRKYYNHQSYCQSICLLSHLLLVVLGLLSAGCLDLVLPVPAAWRGLPPLPPPPSSELRLDMLLPLPRLPPNICMSCRWSMLLSRLCSSLSPRLLKSRLPGRPPIMPPPPPAAPPPDRELPGGGGLFRKSFTFLQ